MKENKIIIPLLLLLFVEVGSVLGQSRAARNDKNSLNKEIKFTEGGWKEIVELATKNNKYIFVDAYAVWCGPCKMLKSNTFKEMEVGSFFNDNFINVTIDMEQGEGELLAKDWDVEAFPTLLFFNPQGDMVLKEIGFLDGKKLIRLGTEALVKK